MTLTDYARIELEPEPDRLLDSADGTPPIPQNTRATVFGDRYVRALDEFEATIDREARKRGRIRGADARHPRTLVELGNEQVEFVYDGDLDQQLLTVYVLYGWAGVQAVEKGITEAEKNLERLLYPWPETRAFFVLTRNLLYAAVVDELVTFERAAAEAISPRLNEARDVAGDAWDALGIRKATDEEARFFETSSDWEGRTAVSASGRRRELAWYTVGKTDVLGRILEVVTPLVAARESLLALRRRRDALESTARGPTWVETPRLIELQAERDDLITRIGGLVTQVEDGYTRLHGISPAAVLAVPMLRTPVGPEGLAGAIVRLTIDVIDEAERIQKALDAGSPWVTGVLGDSRSVHGAPSVPAPERAVAEKALDAVDDDPRYLSMLNLVTLAELTGQSDGLAYVVRSQYTAVLMEVMDEQERSRKVVATIMGLLAKATALVSLVTILTPVGWKLKLAAAALDAGAIAYQVHAAVGQLAQFDRAVDEALVEFDRAEMDKLARLGELVGMRPEFVEQLTATVVTEIGLIVAAGAYPAFRRLVHVRGYYNDIETLLEPL